MSPHPPVGRIDGNARERLANGQKAHPTHPAWALVDEWTVPVTTQIRLNMAGVYLCEDSETVARLIAQTLLPKQGHARFKRLGF